MMNLLTLNTKFTLVTCLSVINIYFEGCVVVSNVDDGFQSSCMYTERMKFYNRIFVYGAGKIARFIMIYLDENNLYDDVDAVLVTNINSIGGGGSSENFLVSRYFK